MNIVYLFLVYKNPKLLLHTIQQLKLLVWSLRTRGRFITRGLFMLARNRKCVSI